MAETFTADDFAGTKTGNSLTFTPEDFSKPQFTEADFSPKPEPIQPGDINPDANKVPDLQATTRGGSPLVLPEGAARSVITEIGSAVGEAVSPATIMEAATLPGKVAYAAAADVISKVPGFDVEVTGPGRDDVTRIKQEYGGNIAAMFNEGPLPVDKFLAEASKSNPKLTTASKVGRELANMAPLSAVAALPAWAAKLAAAGFTADMIANAPELFQQYAEEINKPKEEQDPDKITSLQAGVITTFAFAPLAGAGGVGKPIESVRAFSGGNARLAEARTKALESSLPPDLEKLAPLTASEVVKPIAEIKTGGQNAIQIESANAEVLRQQESQMGLPQVGERNAQPEVAAAAQAKVAPQENEVLRENVAPSAEITSTEKPSEPGTATGAEIPTAQVPTEKPPSPPETTPPPTREQASISSPIRENGARTSVILPDGTAIVGGRFHGETVQEAIRLGLATEQQLANGTAGFTRPDGTSWDLSGKPIEVKSVRNLSEPSPTTNAKSKSKELVVEPVVQESLTTEPVRAAGEIKSGDKIKWEPNENERRYQGPVEGIVVDVISNTEGERGYHVLAPRENDPGNVVRVWDNRGKVVSHEPAKVESSAVREPKSPSADVGTGRTPNRPKTVIEIADEIAARKIDPQASYGEFVKARDLKPEISANEWLPIYRRSLELAKLNKEIAVTKKRGIREKAQGQEVPVKPSAPVTEAKAAPGVEEKLTKAQLVDEILGQKPAQSVANVEARVRWEKDAKELSKRTRGELETIVSDKKISEARERELSDLTRSIIPEVDSIAKSGGQRWRTVLREKADSEGVRFPTAKGMARGDVVYYVSRAIAEKRRATPKPTPPTEPTATGKGVEEPKIQGMGGAIPEEFGQPGSYVSNMFSAIDRDRAEMGKPPMEPTQRRTWDEDGQRALATMNKDPNWIPRIMDEVIANPRPLMSWEKIGADFHRAKLKAEYNNALQRIARAFDDNRAEDLAQSKSEAQMFENELLRMDEAFGRGGTGSEAGRSLRAQAAGIADDLSIVEMVLQKRKANGGRPLTDQEIAEVTRQFNEIQAKNAELEKHLAERDAKIAELEATKAIEQIKGDAKREPEYAPQVIAHAKRIVEQHRKLATKTVDDTLASFFGEGPGMGAAAAGEVGGSGAAKAIPANVLDAAAIKYGQKLMEGASTRAQFDAAVRADWGKKADPYLDQIWEAANKHVDEYLADLDQKIGKPTAEKVKRTVKGADTATRIEATKEAISEKLDEGKKSEISFLAQKLARLFVEQGVTERDPLIDAVHGVLKDIDPTFTRRETMDAISGYGQFKQLTKDAISVQLRDLKGQMQQLGKLEDMASGKAPLKTGVERRSPSDIERQLIQQVNEAKKKGGFEITDPARQLATALTARKTYYRNRLADLKQEIATRERIVKTKTPAPTDVQLEAMKAEYATLKEEHAKIFGDRKLTDEQRLKMALSGVERQIAEYERRIKAGDFTKKATLGLVETPELRAAKARRDALREEFKELRALDETYNTEQRAKSIEQQREALQRQITALELKLQSGQFEPQRAPVNRPADPMLEPLKQRRDELNRKMVEARKKPEAQRHAERLAKDLERLNKRITEKEAAIASRNVAPKPRTQNRPMATPELEQARQKLEALNNQIAEIRHPKMSAVERAIQSSKTRMANQIADLNERMAKGDFQKKARTPTDLSTDPVAMQLKGDLEKVKRDFKRALELDEAKRWSPVKRTFEAAKEVIRFPRQVLSAFDVSAVLRQGGVITYGHPIRAAKSILPMIRAMRSDRNALAIEQQILNRPNATNGNYAKAKLYIAPLDEFRLSTREELMQSRFGDRFPGVRMSNRGFITFLNKMRADSFDAMLDMRERWFEKPVSEAEMKLIANYINIATGRGDMGKFSAAAEALAIPFFSPRLVLSRFQLLTGQPIRKGFIADPLFRDAGYTKALIALEYAKMLAGLAAIYGLAELSGEEIETDPRSSDFGKIKSGNTRIDPMMGLGQATVLGSRLVSGETKTQSGKFRPIRGDLKFGDADAAELMARFLRTKLSPVVGGAVDIASGRNVVGEKVDVAKMFPHLAEEGIEGFPVPGTLFTPLSFRDIVDIMEEQGIARGTAIEMLNLLGMSVQYYEPRKK